MHLLGVALKNKIFSCCEHRIVVNRLGARLEHDRLLALEVGSWPFFQFALAVPPLQREQHVFYGGACLRHLLNLPRGVGGFGVLDDSWLFVQHTLVKHGLLEVRLALGFIIVGGELGLRWNRQVI